jgi:hypothetical protein
MARLHRCPVCRWLTPAVGECDDCRGPLVGPAPCLPPWPTPARPVFARAARGGWWVAWGGVHPVNAQALADDYVVRVVAAALGCELRPDLGALSSFDRSPFTQVSP